MSIIPEWDLKAYIEEALVTLANEMNSDDRDRRVNAAVKMIDNCLSILCVGHSPCHRDEDEG